MSTQEIDESNNPSRSDDFRALSELLRTDNSVRAKGEVNLQVLQSRRRGSTHCNCDESSSAEKHYPSCIRCDRIMCMIPSVGAEYREILADKHSLYEDEFFLKYAKNIEMLKNDPVRPYKFASESDDTIDSDVFEYAREMPFYVVCNECNLDHTISVLTQRIETLELLFNADKEK